MPFIATENSNPKTDIDLHYQDYGEGRPIILIHGWPLSHRMWDKQTEDLVNAGYRVIAYDRRGFGLSDFPWNNYDYDTLAEDLRSLILGLDLRDVTLVGFSMGGGEVVRYCTKYGDDRISQAVLLSSIIPLVAQKDDNPDGVPQEALDDIMENLTSDRMKFLKGFTRDFVNYEDNKDIISEEMLHFDWTVAAYASDRATVETTKAWAGTDFRSELKNVTIPTMVIHGTADQIVPIETSGDQAAAGIADSTYHKLKGAPHGCVYTHAEQVNKLLLDFFRTSSSETSYNKTAEANT
ncbi:alpha/beta hydrolase [Lewinellaceae bacterium SD302]|nr:alpha/beta hydrolase [Lewinellaceae bacterium SD302]